MGLGLAASLAMAMAGCGEKGPRPLDDPGVGGVTSRPSMSTADPYTIAERDVRAATERYDQAFVAALAEPRDQETADLLLSMYAAGVPERDGMERFLQAFVDNEWAALPGPRGYQVVESVRVETPPPGGRATSVTCTFDDGVVYDVANPAPDGGEIVVSDAVESTRTAWTWVFDRDTWRISESATLETWTGENRCPPQ